MNIISGCIFFLVVILRDYSFVTKVQLKFRKHVKNSSPIVQQDNDEDSANQDEQIPKEDIKESTEALNTLLKSYKNITAIHQQKLSAKDIEAGGTMSFKLLIEYDKITSGDIWVKSKCPKTQFDNFLPELTGREVLKIFGLICGFKMDEINEMIENKAPEFKLQEQLDNKVESYTGEDRKKLIAALAQLGNPDLIFLDECKTAADRKALLRIQKMDECEALCTRIGIMVASQFHCLGPVQHLKNKFSKGFILTIKTRFTDESKVRKLREIVVRKFLDVELKWMHLDVLIFHLKTTYMDHSKIFKVLAKIKDKTDIKDYTLTQMELEKVFQILSKGVGPFTPEEATQIATEESKWRTEELIERKSKNKKEIKRTKSSTENEQFMSEKGAKIFKKKSFFRIKPIKRLRSIISCFKKSNVLDENKCEYGVNTDILNGESSKNFSNNPNILNTQENSSDEDSD